MSLLKQLFPLSATNNEDRGWSTFEASRLTVAGERVSPSRAMALSTYFACMRNLSEDCAKLPLLLYRRLGARGKERATDLGLYRVLRLSPNAIMGAMAFRETMTAWALGWGNAIAEIVSDAAGRVIELYPIHPSRVVIEKVNGTVLYKVRNDDQSQTPLLANRVLHLHGLGGDGCRGYSIAQVAAESLGIGLAAQTFSAGFYGNGSNPGGVLETPKALKPEARNNLRQSWHAAYGGPYNAHKVAVLEEDIKWKPMSIPMRDAQFLETRRFQHEEIARWFRMPLSKLQDSQRAQGWSTLDALNTDYVTDALMPWLIRWEQECARKLLLPEEQAVFFIEHEVKGLLRGDAASRSAYYRERFNLGSLTPNEIRELENENPINDPAADRTYVQGAMVPLDHAGQAPAASAGQSMDAEEPVEDAPDMIDAIWPVLLDAAERVWRKELKAVENARGRLKDPRELARWLVSWNIEQREYALGAFAPALRVVGLKTDAVLAAVAEQIHGWPDADGEESPRLLAVAVQEAARAAVALGGSGHG